MEFKTSTPVYQEILAEREKQDTKWKEQNHPSVDQVLTERAGGCSPERMCEEYEIPSETRSKFMVDVADQRGSLTWGHILVEEVSEVISASSEEARREELVQLAAVAVAWIECIDRKQKREANNE